MKIKFTDAFVKSLKATGKPYSHGDSEHRGAGRSSNAAASWAVSTRPIILRGTLRADLV